MATLDPVTHTLLHFHVTLGYVFFFSLSFLVVDFFFSCVDSLLILDDLDTIETSDVTELDWLALRKDLEDAADEYVAF